MGGWSTPRGEGGGAVCRELEKVASLPLTALGARSQHRAALLTPAGHGALSYVSHVDLGKDHPEAARSEQSVLGQGRRSPHLRLGRDSRAGRGVGRVEGCGVA